MKWSVFAMLYAASSATAYRCTTFNAPLTVSFTSLQPAFPPFENHYQAVDLLNALTARNASSDSPFTESLNTTETFNINVQYCTPDIDPHGQGPSSVQILTHGLGFDMSYWSFGGPGSEYNYVKVATEAGYAVLLYDRIGNGLSSIVDPYTIQQAPVELAVLAMLTEKVRAGSLDTRVPKPTGKVLHVGHSFGSILTHALAASAPHLTDAVVLTGYSTNPVGVTQFAISSLFHLAKENQPERFGNRSAGLLTWGDELTNQYAFFAYPFFDPKVLAATEATKFPFAIGEFLTLPLLSFNASSYPHPVLIITGDADRIFCAYDCYGNLKISAPLFASAAPFKTYIQPHTGHGMNMHYNASGMYGVVQEFFTTYA